jgi:lipoprotein-anchoring transpeptidase ErfK/SrfK
VPAELDRVDCDASHGDHTWRGARKFSVHAIGVGRSVTPTPRGRYHITDLVKPPDPNGLHGAYAFGLSAHSGVLTTFGAGDAQVGLHGTDDPHTLGTRVSHGCVRVADRVVESFARHPPLGPPVTIAS